MPKDKRSTSVTKNVKLATDAVDERNSNRLNEISGSWKVHDFRILVLDDEPDCLESMADILRLEGYKVTCASRATDALNLIEASVPDLLLADVMLDDMSGFEVLQHIRTKDNTKNLPVIFLSGLAFHDRQDKVADLDFLEYLVKPVNYDRLFSLIDSLRKAR